MTPDTLTTSTMPYDEDGWDDRSTNSRHMDPSAARAVPVVTGRESPTKIRMVYSHKMTTVSYSASSLI